MCDTAFRWLLVYGYDTEKIYEFYSMCYSVVSSIYLLKLCHHLYLSVATGYNHAHKRSCMHALIHVLDIIHVSTSMKSVLAATSTKQAEDLNFNIRLGAQDYRVDCKDTNSSEHWVMTNLKRDSGLPKCVCVCDRTSATSEQRQYIRQRTCTL